MKIAELRTHRSGKCFDLKFFEPSKTLVSDLENFLPASLKTKLSGNAAAVKDKVTTIIGYESRTDSSAENKELIECIKQFCVEFKYKYKQTVLPSIMEELMYEKAKI